MTLRTLDLALWRRAEAREMALRPSFRLGVHNRAKCDIGSGWRLRPAKGLKGRAHHVMASMG
jgi:hypothetical protein